MGEADRDWNPLENTQPSPIWTSSPAAKLSSAGKATDVNSRALLLLMLSLPPWGRELRPQNRHQMENPSRGSEKNSSAQMWIQINPHERLEMGLKGIQDLKPLCGILGWVEMLVFSWHQIHSFCFSLGTSFSRSGNVPSEKKAVISQLLKDPWEILWEIWVEFWLNLNAKPGLSLAFEQRLRNLKSWEWGRLRQVFFG